ncbi:aminotransferase class III-fold pyridoxal phosphate-dependent enzyme [Nesterenkonia alkaliphila]|uniref:Aminotransferase class III-fold pyridoxal phosphate-dependent enzyme n=2 Tax=Nesterenkonia alkaliphila TaxID=1463631 RepID=A0A7K1UGJ7_9MICC|nr:aminotransferase class III-fold pyridoxal phosphate-dependent enzyme [Nesterenkonia alkaliphila]
MICMVDVHTPAAAGLSPSSSKPEERLAAGRTGYALDRQHVFHSWSAQKAIEPMTVVDAAGSWIWDGEGNRILDLASQLVFTNAGHKHPKIIAAIQEQAQRLCTVAPQHANDARSEAARLITELLPDDINHVFFTNGGADANEHAVRMARLHTGRRKVFSAYRSYHGGTQLAVNLTGDPRRIPNDDDAAVVHFLPAYPYRSYFSAETQEQESERALTHLRSMLLLEGPDQVAALILESVPGTAGIYVPPVGYMQGVRELCDEFGIVFIADEVMAGFGRTGKWFAFEHFGIEPDIVTFAKGVNSGYVPLGGVAMDDAVYNTFAEKPYPGGLTYSGHPLAAAAAVANIGAMREEQMVENAAALGQELIAPRLQQMLADHPSVGDVRGLGAFWAIELVRDQQTKEPLAPYGQTHPVMNQLVASAKSQGVLPFMNMNRLHICPPLNITTQDITFGLNVIDDVLSISDQHATP